MPSELTLPVFWLRFFFRTHQIRKEEEKRKAFIQSLCFYPTKSSLFFLLINILGTTDNDDDFSWEDDEEEQSATADGKPVIVKTKSSIASVCLYSSIK